MHPSDNPWHVIVTPTLTNQNYHTWSRSLKMSLHSKNKLGFIDGTLLRPPTTERNSMAWDRCNTMVMAWITNSISPEIVESILWMEIAKEIWDELKERYHQGDIFRISELQEKIYAFWQGDQNITQYFTMLKKIWQELDNFLPLPTCICVIPCSCSMLTTIKSYIDNDQVIRFLKGLNE